MPDRKTLRSRAGFIVEHAAFTNTIIVLIFLNAFIVGLETIPSVFAKYGSWLFVFDRILLWVFTVEIVLRLVSAKPAHRFFANGWNVFDFIIVASGHLFAGAHFVTVLRVLRVLRLLRAISVIPSLQRLVNALLLTIPALGNIILLMSLIFYIFAVMGTMLFADVSPEYFGSLPLSLITLFQVVTLESWASGVMRPISAEVPWAWAYFVAFILMGTFVIFNLFVGVIVNNVEKTERKDDEDADDGGAASAKDIALLRKEIAELKALMHDRQSKQTVPPPVTKEE